MCHRLDPAQNDTAENVFCLTAQNDTAQNVVAKMILHRICSVYTAQNKMARMILRKIYFVYSGHNNDTQSISAQNRVARMKVHKRYNKNTLLMLLFCANAALPGPEY